MRIVVLDGYTLNPGDNPWTPIERLGRLAVHDHTPDDQVVAQARGHEIVITNKAALSARTIAELPEMKFIAVTATGYNIVDIVAAGQRGIPVSNVPEYGTDSVAQYTFALLLELCHHVGLHDQAVKAGEWTRQRDFCFWKTPLVELAGKTMGIVGFGRIGMRVGQIAHALGMRVLAFDPVSRTEPGYQPFAFRSIEQLFAEADVVTMHCPLTPQNHGMVNASLLSRMKRSAFFINTARGQLVNEHDLAEALNRGDLAGAAVDVVCQEPIRPDNPLLSAKNVIITPHIAWAALEPRQRIMQTTARNIEAFVQGKPINVVNSAYLSPPAAG
ncbi:D-2-hydroxyacid dehydrogenase [Fontivita pretiosa]|uniref:D-2-hydroxyacid dehydrogenase n=1 Tax=Fontivita pretiosa TaxID=2989684 RepID=UPI003D176E00